jgi:hypothetical protein
VCDRDSGAQVTTIGILVADVCSLLGRRAGVFSTGTAPCALDCRQSIICYPHATIAQASATNHGKYVTHHRTRESYMEWAHFKRMAQRPSIVQCRGGRQSVRRSMIVGKGHIVPTKRVTSHAVSACSPPFRLLQIGISGACIILSNSGSGNRSFLALNSLSFVCSSSMILADLFRVQLWAVIAGILSTQMKVRVRVVIGKESCPRE